MFTFSKVNLIVLIVLIATPMLIIDAISIGRNRRRPTLSQTADEDVTDKSEVPDQIAQAAGRIDGGGHYRGLPISYATDQESEKNSKNNYPFGNFEMNLIRPESENPRQHETNPEGSTHYTVNNNESPELEDTETAEEYVAKAMHIYGTRLREPIRITAESLAPDTPKTTVGGSSSGNNDHRESHRSSANVATAASNGVKSYDVFELVERHRQQQEQQQQQQQQQQEEQKAKQQQAEIEAMAQAAQAQAEAQVQAEFQAHMQQQQQQQQQQQIETQTERVQMMTSAQPAPVYEKDPVTRSYDIFDYSSYTPAVDRHYQPKYQTSSNFVRNENEEKYRVSASTEIPKAEIMKQIEKSVMKYMKELEAEGKIVAGPQEKKLFYKSSSGEGKITTGKPKLPRIPGSSSIASSYSDIEYNGREPSSSLSTTSSAIRHHMPRQSSSSSSKLQVQETETSYQPPQDLTDAMAPNIEFVYKIKTRAPLQSAAVKTISKPYTLPLKGTVEQFDHSAALKAMEDFDLSHAITADDESTPMSSSSSSSQHQKPSKMYFNSETYHDINSLPYKPEKLRQSTSSQMSPEYRYAIKSDLPHPDYKGYSGFFVQSDGGEFEKGESSPSSDDGYPIMNPYKYVFKKDSNEATQEQRHKHHPQQYYSIAAAAAAAQKGTSDFDSYNPKFNNNPEGYGYQHSTGTGYKGHSSSAESGGYNHKYQSRHPISGGSTGKRGKRGGPANNKKTPRNAGASKDIEADIALRPPPKV